MVSDILQWASQWLTCYTGRGAWCSYSGQRQLNGGRLSTLTDPSTHEESFQGAGQIKLLIPTALNQHGLLGKVLKPTPILLVMGRPVGFTVMIMQAGRGFVWPG